MRLIGFPVFIYWLSGLSINFVVELAVKHIPSEKVENLLH